MSTEYATPENELPYVPDLHIEGTMLTPKGLRFWLSNSLFRTGYDKIKWDKEEGNEGN